MMQRIINSKSKTFLAFCFSFLTGVAVASLVEIRLRGFLFAIIFIFILFLLGFFWQNRSVRFLFLIIVCFFVGTARFILALPVDLIPPKNQFTGFITGEPDIRMSDVRYIVESNGQRVYIKMPLYPEYQYGDSVRVNCVIEAPEKDIDGFRYDMYLARLGVFWMCRDGEIEKASVEDTYLESGWGIQEKIFKAILLFKNRLQTRVEKLWPEPHASFIAGL